LQGFEIGGGRQKVSIEFIERALIDVGRAHEPVFPPLLQETRGASLRSPSLRDVERAPGEKSILAYDHLEADSEFVMNREEGESDENYTARVSHFNKFFS